MEEGKQTTIATLLNSREADVTRLNVELAEALAGLHRRARLMRRAQPPTDAQFAARIGLKVDTYAKIKRNLMRGRPTRWSRTSLAAISLNGELPEAICLLAHNLLWLVVLRGTKSASSESAIVLRALVAPDLFAALANVAEFNEDDACARRSFVGGQNAEL